MLWVVSLAVLISLDYQCQNVILNLCFNKKKTLTKKDLELLLIGLTTIYVFTAPTKHRYNNYSLQSWCQFLLQFKYTVIKYFTAFSIFQTISSILTAPTFLVYRVLSNWFAICLIIFWARTKTLLAGTMNSLYSSYVISGSGRLLERERKRFIGYIRHYWTQHHD